MADADGHSHDENGACCSTQAQTAYSSVTQTLDEMEFERGVWTAAMSGDEDGVRKYLDKDGDPNAQDSSGYTALHYASRNGHDTICRLLLDKGADPNLQTKSGATPLHRAVYCGHVNVVKLLLNNRADPTITDDDGKSPLHKAAEKGDYVISQMLISVNTAVGEAIKDIIDYKDNMAMDYVPDDNQQLKEFLRPSSR